MLRTRLLAATAAITVLAAGSAFAQTAPGQTPPTLPESPGSVMTGTGQDTPTTPPAQDDGTPPADGTPSTDDTRPGDDWAPADGMTPPMEGNPGTMPADPAMPQTDPATPDGTMTPGEPVTAPDGQPATTVTTTASPPVPNPTDGQVDGEDEPAPSEPQA
jgi:hypothetical protein